MLNNTGIRDLALRIVDNRIALEIIFIRQILTFKPQGSIFQLSITIVKKLIDHTCIQYLFKGIFRFCQKCFVLCFQSDWNVLQQFFRDLCITAYRNALIPVIKIIIIISITQWQSFYDKRRKLFAVTPPLLLRITPDQLFIYRRSGKRDCLLFQILRIGNTGFLDLLCDHLFCLFWRIYAEQSMKSIHIKRQIIKLAFINRYRRIDVIVEICQRIDIVPHFPVRCMENMGTILMHLDSMLLFRINIARNMVSFFYYQTGFPRFFHLMGKHAAKQPRAHDQIIIFHKISSSIFVLASQV